MKIIKNEKNIELIIPIEAFTTDSNLQDLKYKAEILGLETDRAVDSDGKIYKRIYLNFTEVDLMMYMVNAYAMNWLKSVNTPYIELPKSTKVSLPTYSDAVWENETSKLIRIYDKVDGIDVEIAKQESLKAWMKKYPTAKWYTEPKEVSEIMKNYIQDEN